VRALLHSPERCLQSAQHSSHWNVLWKRHACEERGRGNVHHPLTSIAVASFVKIPRGGQPRCPGEHITHLPSEGEGIILYHHRIRHSLRASLQVDVCINENIRCTKKCGTCNNATSMKSYEKIAEAMCKMCGQPRRVDQVMKLGLAILAKKSKLT
jgi:hypothetical protein